MLFAVRLFVVQSNLTLLSLNETPKVVVRMVFTSDIYVSFNGQPRTSQITAMLACVIAIVAAFRVPCMLPALYMNNSESESYMATQK